MKRLLAILSLAVLAAPSLAVAAGALFEQTQFDRGLGNGQEQRASAGSTRVETSVWADDHNFVAPAP